MRECECECVLPVLLTVFLSESDILGWEGGRNWDLDLERGPFADGSCCWLRRVALLVVVRGCATAEASSVSLLLLVR